MTDEAKQICHQVDDPAWPIARLSIRKQTYIEDCELCCNPIEISYTVADEALAEFWTRILG